MVMRKDVTEMTTDQFAIYIKEIELEIFKLKSSVNETYRQMNDLLEDFNTLLKQGDCPGPGQKGELISIVKNNAACIKLLNDAQTQRMEALLDRSVDTKILSIEIDPSNPEEVEKLADRLLEIYQLDPSPVNKDKEVLSFLDELRRYRPK